MESYEITFIVDEDGSSDGVEKVLKESGAEISKTNDLGVKQFVYPIKKKNTGHYFAIEFKSEAEGLIEIESELKAEKTLVRYLIIKSLRKGIEPVRTGIYAKKEEGGEVVKAPEATKQTEEVKKEVKIEEKPVEEESKVEEKTETVETPEEKPKEESVVAKEEKKPVAKEEKPAPVKKPRAKAAKVSAEELDKKLEELVKE